MQLIYYAPKLDVQHLAQLAYAAAAAAAAEMSAERASLSVWGPIFKTS